MKTNLMHDYTYAVNGKIWDKLKNINLETNLQGYENDQYSLKLNENLQKLGYDFARFVSSGTGGNILAINSIVSNHGSILVSDVAHVYRSENNAPFSHGVQALVVETDHSGKIVIDKLNEYIRFHEQNFIHSSIEAISITFPTELGAVYTVEELKQIREICEKNNLKIHVDGARFFNGLSNLNISIEDFNNILNPDVTLIGGNKMGLFFGELVAYRNGIDKEFVRRIQKKTGQQMAKAFLGTVQFNELMFEDELWKEISEVNNSKMCTLISKINKCSNLELHKQDSYTNICFVKVNNDDLDRLLDNIECSVFDSTDEYTHLRFVTNVHSNVEDLDFNKIF